MMTATEVEQREQKKRPTTEIGGYKHAKLHLSIPVRQRVLVQVVRVEYTYTHTDKYTTLGGRVRYTLCLDQVKEVYSWKSVLTFRLAPLCVGIGRRCSRCWMDSCRWWKTDFFSAPFVSAASSRRMLLSLTKSSDLLMVLLVMLVMLLLLLLM